MPNQHKHPGITWHSADPDMKPWIEAEAERRGITQKALLDEALSGYRERAEHARQVEARTTNERIRVGLREARRDPATTETTQTPGVTS